ncbi:MAG: hypothetical protein AM326_03725 [Candidatus Thorarchaeota archaeon SMTZ-45]|nr:MAG: hypothetical protein AM326_03725 [Candidatus Thorarchaeota archaeon SMTZ-45]
MTSRKKKHQSRTYAARIKLMGIISLLVVVMLVSPMFLQMQAIPVSNTTRLPRDASHHSAEDAILNLTYWSRTNSTIDVVNPGERIGGDHVILEATWTPSVLVGSVSIEVTAIAIPSVVSNSSTTNSVRVDTRALGNNGTCTINSTVWLLNGTSFSESVENIYIGNFFTPRVNVLTPNGGETWTGVNNVTWNAWDANQDEVLTYDVLVSFDSGATFQSLASNLNRTWYMWDCSAYPILNTYLIEIIVTDGIYYESDRSDATFAAGETTTPTITTNTTTTTTLPPPIDSRVAIFLLLFVLTSGIMALVVYYAAKKWF